MLSSPYPSPPLKIWTVAMVLGALQGIAAGVWVLVSPPVSYEGLGLTLTFIWGGLIVLGATLVALGNLTRIHQIEIPGLVFAIGGVLLYVYLSWEQTFVSSPGSGPRALFLGWLMMFLLTRLVLLVYIDLKARARIESREPPDAG